MRAGLRAFAVAVLGAACIFGAAFGVLVFGLQSPSAAERTALRILAELQRTRGVHAVLEVDGHRLLSTCRSSLGRDVLQLSDGTRLLVVGVHAYRLPPQSGSPADVVSDQRELFVVHGSHAQLVSAQAAIAGSHAFWARVLVARLEQANVHVRTIRFGGRPAYDLGLSTRPLLELIVDKATLRPVAAVYRSRAVSASSRLIASRRAVGGC